MSSISFALLKLAPARVEVQELPDGGILLRSPDPLEPYPPHLIVSLEHWATVQPDRLFLSERDIDGRWQRVSFSQALVQVRALAQGLLELELGPDRPVMILSDNSIPHALLTLAAMMVGAPVAPISPAYSLLSQDHARLKYLHGLLEPGLIFAEDGLLFEKALSSLRPGCPILVSRRAPIALQVLQFETLLGKIPSSRVDQALANIGPDTVAKLLFTSGSTGMPRGVINSQRMLCANQQAILQLWPFLADAPPVVVDWLPWSHTFGGNHNFNLVLTRGGTFYIDHGKPVPGRFDESLRNLLEISPTLYFNAPRGYDMLLPHLEQDHALRERFFASLQVIFYAAAALPQPLWDRLERLSVATRGERVHMFSAWGSTETAPMATAVHFPIERAGVIGLPAPGTELWLAPTEGRLELRVRGPNVTPGYFRDPQRTAEVLDEAGFYRTGDAGHLRDPAHVEAGLVFDGRLAENFKLMSGTWVQVGALRTAVVDATSPYVQDVVVTGHDGLEVGLLIFPNLLVCRSLCRELASDETPDAIVSHPLVRQAIRSRLEAFNRAHPTSSSRIARALLLGEPPSIDGGEITDKGYINQRAVRERREDVVRALHEREAGGDVLVF